MKTYISAEDLLEWLNDRYPAGESEEIDELVSNLEEHVSLMPYMVGGRIESDYEQPKAEPDAPDPFDNPFIDELLEEEWND